MHCHIDISKMASLSVKRSINNRIDKLHVRALRLVYKDDEYTFEQLLDKDNNVTIHHRNLQ